MRIIAGKYKSRKINSLPDNKITRQRSFRPTLDRSRETLFNVLNNLIEFEGITALDLFAGTGAFGFETISRGAQKCTFLDISSDSAKIIAKTAEELECKNQVEIVRAKAESFLRENTGAEFNLVFADPPYDYKEYDNLIKAIEKIHFEILVIETDNALKIKMKDK